MKFLIAGLGSIGRRHLRNLVALDETDIILYRTNQSTLSDEELAGYPAETNLEAALAHAPDGVIVANPTALHMAVALPAAQADCHLLIEKPVAAQMGEEVNQLRQIVLETGVQTLVGFQFRFHPVLNEIKTRLASGQLGQVYSFRVHWGEYLPGWHPWEDYRQSYAARKDLGGGVVNTLCHPLDYVRWLFGEVDSLVGVTGQVSDLDLEVEDIAEITLTFASGCVGSVHLDYFQRPPAHWMEINCEGGQIRWDNATGAAQVYFARGDHWEQIHPPQGFERNTLFLEEMRHFIQLMQGQGTSRCSLEDGIKVLELTEAVHAMNRQG